jgi:membrane associated rhomboid family serine protease
MGERSVILRALLRPFLLSLAMLACWEAQQYFQLSYTDFGVYPRDVRSLSGILTMPLFHGSSEHLWGNLISIFSLYALLSFFSPHLSLAALLIIWLSGGSFLWIIGRASWHIGASGIVYGLIAWFPAMAILRRNLGYRVLAGIVLLYYGSSIWGLFPYRDGVSFEGHIAGLLGGILAAWLLRKGIPEDEPGTRRIIPLSIEPQEDPYEHFDHRQRESSDRPNEPDDEDSGSESRGYSN